MNTPSRTPQNALTVLVDVLEGREGALIKLLKEVGENIDTNNLIDFKQLTTTHFLKWVILPADISKLHPSRVFPAHLVLESNYDGDLDDYLKELWEVISKAIESFYSHCKGFPADCDLDKFKAYFKQHVVPIGAFYVGLPGESVQRTQADEALRKKLQDFLDKFQRSPAYNPSPEVIHKELFDRALDDPATEAMPAAKTLFGQPSKPLFNLSLPVSAGLFLGFIVIIIAGIVSGLWYLHFHGAALLILATIIISLIGLLVRLRILEKHDALAWRMVPNALSIVPEREDWEVQNPMTHLVEIKPGFLRLLLLKVVLWAINQLAKVTYNQGNLGGIPTIHFARWVIIDQNRRLLFFSNYDGSWESYLGDFIMRANVGLTGVWSNTVDFPPAEWVVNQGAKHADAFKEWTRRHQVETQIWYSAYPNSSISNRTKSRDIRNGLLNEELSRKNVTDQEAAEWLKLF
jgi:hypothetical protein